MGFGLNHRLDKRELLSATVSLLLTSTAHYYNGVRTHRSLDKDKRRSSARLSESRVISSRAILGGLHHPLRPYLGFR